MTDSEIVLFLRGKYGNEIMETVPFPQPKFTDKAKVKAIYLGCDPSNIRNDKLKFAFALEGTNPIYKRFIASHEENLKAINLGWEDLYVQNLCQNYFQEETSKNVKLWKQAAKEFWCEHLYNELSIFPVSVPVLLTAQCLLEVLALDGYEKIPAMDFYECRIPVPVSANKNKLGRPLIPFYRGINPKILKSYSLSTANWPVYQRQIIKMFE